MLRMSVNPTEGIFMVFVFINELQKVELLIFLPSDRDANIQLYPITALSLDIFLVILQYHRAKTVKTEGKVKFSVVRTYTYSLFPCLNNNVHIGLVPEQNCIISLYIFLSDAYSSIVAGAAQFQAVQQLYTLSGRYC